MRKQTILLESEYKECGESFYIVMQKALNTYIKNNINNLILEDRLEANNKLEYK